MHSRYNPMYQYIRSSEHCSIPSSGTIWKHFIFRRSAVIKFGGRNLDRGELLWICTMKRRGIWTCVVRGNKRGKRQEYEGYKEGRKESHSPSPFHVGDKRHWRREIWEDILKWNAAVTCSPDPSPQKKFSEGSRKIIQCLGFMWKSVKFWLIK